MPYLIVILLAFGFVLFVVAAWVPPPPEQPRWKLVCYGLACWIGAEIIARGAGLAGVHF